MTAAEKLEFIQWHETVICRHDYPERIYRELRQARDRWLATVKVRP